VEQGATRYPIPSLPRIDRSSKHRCGGETLARDKSIDLVAKKISSIGRKIGPGTIARHPAVEGLFVFLPVKRARNYATVVIDHVYSFFARHCRSGHYFLSRHRTFTTRAHAWFRNRRRRASSRPPPPARSVTDVARHRRRRVCSSPSRSRQPPLPRHRLTQPNRPDECARQWPPRRTRTLAYKRNTDLTTTRPRGFRARATDKCPPSGRAIGYREYRRRRPYHER